MRIFLSILAGFMICFAVMPSVRLRFWWVRSCDFPRLQAGLISLAVLLAYLPFWDIHSVWQNILLALLAIAVTAQFLRVAPYTPIYPLQVKDFDAHENSQQISFLISNVQLENRESDKLVRAVQAVEPDVCLAVETDDWWCDQLERMKDDYPHIVRDPHKNGYGMMLLSKYPLDDVQLRCLTRDQVPSIRASIVVSEDLNIVFYGVHPPPPYPGSADTSTPRDAELAIVAQEVQELDGRPAIVAGDLNDVAWSHTTRLFQRISGMLDPRVGRGMYSSFHAKHWFARWPLDHLFHSDHFKLVELKILPSIGSDHFPVFVKLSFEPEDRGEQAAAEKRDGDDREAKQTVDEERKEPNTSESAENSES